MIGNQRSNSFLWLGLILIGLFLGGCVSLSEDITPPPSAPEATEIEPAQTVEGNGGEEPGNAFPTQEPGAGQQDPDPSDEPSETEVFSGAVAVHFINQGAEDLPGTELTVRLEGYDHMTQVYTGSMTAAADQEARFEDVPMIPGRLFFASVSYQGAVYRSDITQVEDGVDELTLDVDIYGTTADQSSLSIDRVHIFVDFPSPDTVQLGEMFVISNFGDRTVVSGEADDFVLEFPLPENASNLSFQNGSLGGRFRKTEEGFGDTASIPPGSGVYQVMVFYDLPYPRSRLQFNQELPLPVGSAVIMTPVGTVQVKGEQIQDLGVRQIQDGSIQVFIRENITAGEEFAFTLTGKPEQGGAVDQSGRSPGQTSLWIGGGVLGIVLVAVGIWLFRRFRSDRGTKVEVDLPATRQQLLDAIIDLDDRFQAGQIGQEEHRERRAALKKQLAALLEKEQGQG